jgi:putative Mg2+ transporter-C (MgtC) family protein
MELNAAVPLIAASPDLAMRLGFAAAIGLLLGVDRELRGVPAGLRTHGLICLATSALTVSMISLSNTLDTDGGDPLRMYEAAGSFIGIIGAGLVVFNKGKLHNITTAAHLFLTAVIGIACGAAQWPLVAVAAPTGLIMLSVVRLAKPKDETAHAAGTDDATPR